jgi:hypothetical protein
MSPPSCADLINAVANHGIELEGALTAKEVEDPTSLPFAVARDEDKHKAYRASFLKIIAGDLNSQCRPFLRDALSLDQLTDPPLHAQLIYLGLALAKTPEDCQVARKDFQSVDQYKKVLAALDADQAWEESTKAKLVDDKHMTEVQALAALASARLQAVAEEGYKRKVFDHPFWILPPADALRQVRTDSF